MRVVGEGGGEGGGEGVCRGQHQDDLRLEDGRCPRGWGAWLSSHEAKNGTQRCGLVAKWARGCT